MSALTAAGRKSLRDQQRNYMSSVLRRHEWFERVPSQILSGLAELLLTSRELRAVIKTEGVMRVNADGTRGVHPAVEHFRKYKLAELNYIQTILQGMDSEPVDDLVAQMARHVDAEPSAAKSDPPKDDDQP